MATFNRAKLVEMMERQRAANIAIRDLSDRIRESRERVSRHRIRIEENAAQHGAHATRLFQLALKDAKELQPHDVEGYADHRGERWKTGISFRQWRDYVLALEQLRNLQDRHEKLRSDSEGEFAIVSPLVYAVKEWKLWDRALEEIH